MRDSALSRPWSQTTVPHGAHGCLEGHGRSHEAQRAPLSHIPAVPVPGGPCGLAFHSSCPSSQRLAFFSSLEMEQEAGRVQGRKASPATAEARSCLPVFVDGSTAHSSTRYTRSVVPAASIRDGHRPETSYPGLGGRALTQAAPRPPSLPCGPQTVCFPPPRFLLCHIPALLCAAAPMALTPSNLSTSCLEPPLL